MPHIASIAVFCGSNFGGDDAYAQGARQLGRSLAANGIRLVYGGTTKGLMGQVADAALKGGGQVHGVITRRLHEKGHSHSGLSEAEIMLSLVGSEMCIRDRLRRLTWKARLGAL